MARTVSAQVARRNAAAERATTARNARRAAHAVVVELEARVATADAAWREAQKAEAVDGDDWLFAMMDADTSASDELYAAFERLSGELDAARTAHTAATTAHDAAEASLAAAQDAILADRSRRFRELCRRGGRNDYGHE